MKSYVYLWEFIMNEFPFAFYGNSKNEYSNEEYNLAQNHLKPYLKYLNSVNKKLLFQTFACLIRSIKNIKSEFERNWTDKSFKEKGLSWNQYYKMIFEFNRVLQSFYYETYEGELEYYGKLFPIKKVIFKGAKKKQEIVLEGHILEILRGIFNSFNSVYGKTNTELMKDFSFSFYAAYQEFMMQWQILTAEEGTIAKQLIKNRQESSKVTAFNKYKYQSAYYIHLFLEKNSTKEKAKYPAWHCRFIGEFFELLGFSSYLGYTDNKKIQNWIGRGNPANLTQTRKSKK